MSYDTSYIIEFNGPVGMTLEGIDEVESLSRKLSELPCVQDPMRWNDTNVLFETKHSYDDEVLVIAQEYGASQVLKRHSDTSWVIIYPLPLPQEAGCPPDPPEAD